MQMQAALLYGPRDVRLEQAPVPEPGPGEVVVQVKAATTCGTDAKVYVRGGHPKMIRPPAIFGHEFAGVISAVGAGVEGWQVGDRVVPANSAPCGHCFYCRESLPSMCEDLLFINGAYAQYALVAERIVRVNLQRVPDHLPFEHAALVEPLACVVHGVERIPVRLGDTVVVNGAGPIGLFFLQLLVLRGARVIQTDASKERLEIAERLGADETIDATEVEDTVAAVRELTVGGRGCDVAVEATGIPQVWEAATKMARKGGTVLLFGGCKPGTTFTTDTAALHYGELTLKGVFHLTPKTLRTALALLSRGKINAEAMITARLPLERLPEGLELILNRKGVKSAILPPGSDA